LNCYWNAGWWRIINLDVLDPITKKATDEGRPTISYAPIAVEFKSFATRDSTPFCRMPARFWAKGSCTTNYTCTVNASCSKAPDNARTLKVPRQTLRHQALLCTKFEF